MNVALARCLVNDESVNKFEILGMETVGGGDVALGSAGGGEDGFGSGQTRDAVFNAKSVAIEDDFSLKRIRALRFLEDEDVFEESYDGLAEEE